MASWSDVMNHVRDNYTISEEGPGYCRLLLRLNGGRSQFVFLFHSRLVGGSEDWVEVQSPVGRVTDVPLRPLMQDVGELVVGGALIAGDMILLKHSVPLANLELNDFERPMVLIMHSADDLEKKYVGSDPF